MELDREKHLRALISRLSNCLRESQKEALTHEDWLKIERGWQAHLREQIAEAEAGLKRLQP